MCFLLIRISCLIYVVVQGQILREISSYWSVTSHLHVSLPCPVLSSDHAPVSSYKEFGLFSIYWATYLFFTLIPLSSRSWQRQLLRIQIPYLSITMKTTVDTKQASKQAIQGPMSILSTQHELNNLNTVLLTVYCQGILILTDTLINLLGNKITPTDYPPKFIVHYYIQSEPNWWQGRHHTDVNST